MKEEIDENRSKIKEHDQMFENLKLYFQGKGDGNQMFDKPGDKIPRVQNPLQI